MILSKKFHIDIWVTSPRYICLINVRLLIFDKACIYFLTKTGHIDW